MLVVEHQGIPIGGQVASSQQAEVKLAEVTLATVKVPRAKGRRAPVPRKWWRTKDMTVAPCDDACGGEGLSLVFQRAEASDRYRAESRPVQLPPALEGGTDLCSVGQLPKVGGAL
jgi:hypothetical protein